MSFSDFGRTAMAALSSTADLSRSPASGVSKSRNVRRASDPIPSRRSGGERKPGTTTTPRGNSRVRSEGGRGANVEGEPHRRRSDGAIADRGEQQRATANVLEIQRGVRPKLDGIRCPVTKKTLMDDVLTVQSGGGDNNEKYADASLASTSVSSSTTNRDPSTGTHDGDDSEDTDGYSDSDIGLNAEANSRSYKRSSRNTQRRNKSHLDARKGGILDQEGLQKDSRSCNSPQNRRRRLPKYYNTIPEAEAYGSRTTANSKHHRDPPLKRNRSKKKENTNKKDVQHQSRSQSSELSTGIAQFQKMVAELESLSKISSSSPEAMWKSRILLRSTKDADRDLQLALERNNEMKEGATRSVAAAALASSQKKLKRDYQRASEQLLSIVEDIERRQRAEISTLTASEAAAAHGDGGRVASRGQSRSAAVAEEDFFERAMRERQDEVQKVSDGMKKVQEIYTDLAELVDGQQEQFDKLEELNEEVKADTRAGLEEIQHGMWKLCVADANESKKVDDDSSFDRAGKHGDRKPMIPDPSEILNCMMVCPEPPTKSKSRRGILSIDDADVYHEQAMATAPHQSKNSSTHARSDYYSDEHGLPSDWKWNLPKLEDVQESAQNAYERGHAMVGDLVEQVVKGEVLPLQLSEVQNRISCTPKTEDYSFFGNDDSVVTGMDERRSEDTNASKGPSAEDLYRKDFDVEPRCHRRDGDHRRSGSSHRSRSRSKPRQKHHSNHR